MYLPYTHAKTWQSGLLPVRVRVGVGVGHPRLEQPGLCVDASDLDFVGERVSQFLPVRIGKPAPQQNRLHSCKIPDSYR